MNSRTEVSQGTLGMLTDDPEELLNELTGVRDRVIAEAIRLNDSSVVRLWCAWGRTTRFTSAPASLIS